MESLISILARGGVVTNISAAVSTRPTRNNGITFYSVEVRWPDGTVTQGTGDGDTPTPIEDALHQAAFPNDGTHSRP